MKNFILYVILIIFYAQFGYAQNKEIRAQRITTVPQTGIQVESQLVTSPPSDQISGSSSAPLTRGINWQVTDPVGVAYFSEVSSQSQKTVAGWGTNNDRLSLYGNSNIPIWEVPFTVNANYVMVDMTDDGTRIANGGMSGHVEVYAPESSVPLWSTTFSRDIIGIQILNDGQKVYVASQNPVIQDSLWVYCYIVGQNTPLWVKSFPGTYYTALVLSKSGNRLLLGQGSGGINKFFVLNPATGEQIFQRTGLQQQLPPAISDDGKYIVCGDVSAHVFLLEYIESNATYAEKWNYTVNGTNSWVAGMGISGDGSTIGIGTLTFPAGGGNNGDFYVFNNYSPVPLWIYPNMGDMVQCVDLSFDGSIIAAAGWGPINNSTPDVMLFRKLSSVPYLTVNSPGSNFCLDLSADGKLCVAGGKSVHARVMGNGGKLYNINSDPGGGILSGHAYKSGTTEQAGVKVEVLGISNYFTYSNDESAYSLPYIPAGTYAIKYSCIGFVPQELTGVTIIESQTTVRDVTLLSTGDPPLNLVATQGAGLNVNLTWEAPQTGTILGYKLYRKLYAPDFFPETPLAILAPTVLTYNDNTALPTRHYFYVVTAVLAGDLQSPYSNIAEGWISTGYIAHELSSYVGTAPVIDGVISPGEWTDAYKSDISDLLGTRDNMPNPIGSVMAYFKVNPTKTSLYCAVENFNDAVLEDHDEVAFYVDDNNDGAFPPPGDDSEGNYWAVHYASGDLVRYRPLYNNGGVGNVLDIPNAQIHVSAASGHLVYEFVIPLGPGENWKINFNAQSQSGITAFVLDDPSNYDGYWPITNLNLFNPAGYGVINFGDEDLVPPPPVNMVLSNQPPSMVITLTWDQPEINDFDHFNIYSSVDLGIFNIIGTTIGVEYFYTLPYVGSYIFYVTTVDHAGHESVPSEMVTIGAGQSYMLNGTINYANAAQTHLPGIVIDLKNASGTVIATTTTNVSGGYAFGGLTNGNYTLAPATTKLWGGVTAADVLLFKKHIANVSYLTGIFLASGDVNASGSLTAADVLLIKKRIAYVTNSFAVGDWLFNNIPFTINGANQTQNFNGLCFGDANGSYAPPVKGAPVAEQPELHAGSLTIGSALAQNGAITVSVFAYEVVNLGSFQYTLGYDPSKLTFTDADHWYGGIENVVIGNPQPGKLTFVWASDASGISMANEKLFDLHFTSNSPEASTITWSDVPTIREFADYDGVIFTPAYSNGAVSTMLGIESTTNSQLVIYPNPAKDFITVKYTDKILSVKVINYNGQVLLAQKVNATDVKINTSVLKPGVYFIQIETKNGLINKSIAVEK